MWLTSDLAEKVDAPKSFFPVGVSERELLLYLLEEHYNRPSSVVYSYDGLDRHVCSFGNNYGFMIYEEMLGISDEYKRLADNLNLDYLDLILHVGEDFELLFTISKDNIEKLPFDYKVIGEVTDSDVVELTLENGFVERIENRGYEHYVSE